MRVVIERIEDGLCSVELENGKIICVPAELFADCKEGDVVYISPDNKETEIKKAEIEIDVSKLFDN